MGNDLFEGSLQSIRVVKGTAAGGGKGNFSESETQHHIVVPTYKRYWLYGGIVNVDASATCSIRIYDESDNLILALVEKGAAVAIWTYPYADNGNVLAYSGKMPIPLKAGWYIRFTFGANQAAAASCGAIVREVGASE